MKLHRSPTRPGGGFTLIEMSLVIFLLIALMTTGLYFSSAINDWQLGRQASEKLRAAYVAQRTFLADYPLTSISTLSRTQLLEYLPNRPPSFPTVEALDGRLLTIRVSVSPPYVDSGNGTPYDPSGNSKDSLWDVGE